MSDNDVLIKYNHRNRGVHGVRGPATRRDYGYRSSGETFYVDMRDASVAPAMFEIIEVRDPMPPESFPPRAATPPPTLLSESLREATQAESAVKSTILDHARFDLERIPDLSPANVQAMKASGFVTASAILSAGEEGLVKVKGIGAVKAKRVIEYIRGRYAGD